jgi:hypothetical protein
MATPVQTHPQGVLDALGVPGLAAIGPNLRVTLSGVPAGVVGETLTFPGTPTATLTWATGSTRASAVGLPIVTQLGQGPTVTIAGVPGGPVQVVAPDLRVTVG